MAPFSDFARLIIQCYAISLAKPGQTGKAFNWKIVFPEMAVKYVRIQWAMAAKNPKTADKRVAEVRAIAEEVGLDFSEITGKP